MARTRMQTPRTRRPAQPVIDSRLPVVICSWCGEHLPVPRGVLAGQLLTEHVTAPGHVPVDVDDEDLVQA